ncbi:gliding motility associated protein GldN [Bernardetia litoralis DSM 6794]|uniref:Gliding motility associated protein GldN n=2 Tax=Bernardetia litoralis TaxID=999 RepID=I4AHA4_BERLS|nr:gliding motility associated protein GldN [Bernardetia litoralis DSM 6794]
MAALVCGVTFSANAQEFGMEYAQDGYNHNSIRPLHESHIMYKKTLWFRMSLKEKQNLPFFAAENEITKVIIDAVKLGIIRPYANDSLRTRMSQEEFLENLTIPSEEVQLTEEEIAMGFTSDDLGGFGGGGDDWGSGGDGGGGDGGGGDGAEAETAANEFYPNQLHLLELKEDLLFDNKHSRMKHDIQAITIIIPAEMNPSTGLEKKLAAFSYKELVQNLFRDNSQAIWYNEHNNRHHRNLEEAFDLRLFNARVIKYDNAKNDMIIDIYEDDRSALIAAQQYEHQLVEYESHLWEN